MNFFTRAMVGVTGHYIDRNTRPEDVSGLSKIGLSIIFASCLAALQFGIAGWYLSQSLDTDARIAFVIVAALLGASIVLIIDRNFIYAADTRSETSGFLTYFYLVTRIFLILTISSLSSQFTLPLLLKSELAIHVQDLRDERYDTAKERYTNKYEVKDKVESEEALARQMARLKTAIANMPDGIARLRIAAEQCTREYDKKIQNSIGPDIDENDVSNLYARDKAECERLESSYRQAYNSYLAPKKAELSFAEDSYKEVHQNVLKAKTALNTDLVRTDENNNLFLNVASSDVMWSLIKNNPGARSKYLMITLVQLVLELMPLLLKSLLGRSPLGIRIAQNAQKMQHQYEEAKHRYDLSDIERNAIKEKARNEHAKGSLTDQIAIQEMKNRLASLKAATRMNYFGMNGERTFPNVQTAWKSPLTSFWQQGWGIKGLHESEGLIPKQSSASATQTEGRQAAPGEATFSAKASEANGKEIMEPENGAAKKRHGEGASSANPSEFNGRHFAMP